MATPTTQRRLGGVVSAFPAKHRASQTVNRSDLEYGWERFAVERIQGPDAGEQLMMALDWLPKSIATRLGFVHFFIGDPFFAGLHRFEIADDGGSYRTAAQYVSESCQIHRPRSARRGTIVLPYGPGRTSTVVHELGHALDDVLGEEWMAKPVSNYARVDGYEAFAEAFTAWVGLPNYQNERDRLYRIDRDTATFFDAITLQL
jgi:hypothetical protein